MPWYPHGAAPEGVQAVRRASSMVPVRVREAAGVTVLSVAALVVLVTPLGVREAAGVAE